MDTISTDIIDKLASCIADPSVSIRKSSRIYHDLGMAGDDLYDFVIWLSHKFGIDIEGLDLSLYAPTEGAWGNGLFRKKIYRELMVSDLIELAEAGSWKKSKLSRI